MNFLEISGKFLEMSKKFLESSQKFLEISMKVLECSRKILENSKKFLEKEGGARQVGQIRFHYPAYDATLRTSWKLGIPRELLRLAGARGSRRIGQESKVYPSWH